MRSSRDARLASFLDAAGWESAAQARLAGDASNRSYRRLSRRSGTAILMDAPPEKGEATAPFVRMTRWLRKRGFAAPGLLSEDADAGLLLMEDLGDALFARHLASRPKDEAMLYGAAVDLLADLAVHAPPDWLAPYDRAALDREAALFVEWWLPAAGRPAGSEVAAEFLDLVRDATTVVAEVRDTVVLRDYHAENLLWLPERRGRRRVGLLDYQDALAGHAAYDLVSLLEDARRDTGADLRAAMISRYLALRPSLDPQAFRAACAVFGMQRNLKILGIFARLAVRDSKPRYLRFVPRVRAHLRRNLAHPPLAPLRAWIARVSPESDAEALAGMAGKIAR